MVLRMIGLFVVAFGSIITHKLLGFEDHNFGVSITIGTYLIITS